MQSGEQRLNFIISAANMATPGIMAVQAGFANLTAVGMRTSSMLTEGLSTVEAGFMAAGAGAALAIGMVTIEAAKFEQQMRYVQAVSDSSNSQINQMSEQVKRLSMQYGMSATEISKSMQEIGRAGIKDSAAQVTVFTNALKMAKIEGMDLQTAITGIIQQTNLFGGDLNNPEQWAGKSSEITKSLVHASQISPTSVEQLLMGAKYSGGSASLAGWSPDQLYGTLAYMASKGAGGEVGGTALRGFLTKSAMDQPQVAEALGQIGLKPSDLWKPGGNAALDPVAMFKLITEHMQGLSKQEQMGIWAKITQQKTAQQIMKIDPEGLQDYMNKMKEKFDLDEKVATAMNSVMEQFNRLKATLEVISINMGDKFLPYLRASVDGLVGLGKAASDNTPALTGIAAVLAGTTFLGMAAVGKWTAGIFGYGFDAIRGMGESASSLGGRLSGLSGPANVAIQAQNRVTDSAAKAGKAYREMGMGIQTAAKAQEAYAESIVAMDIASAYPAIGGGRAGKGAAASAKYGPWGYTEWMVASNALLGRDRVSYNMGDPFLGKEEIYYDAEKTSSSKRLKNVERAQVDLINKKKGYAKEIASLNKQLLTAGEDEIEAIVKSRDAKMRKSQNISGLLSGIFAIEGVDWRQSESRGWGARLKGLFATEKTLVPGLANAAKNSEGMAASFLSTLGSATTLLPVVLAVGAAVAVIAWTVSEQNKEIERAKKQQEQVAKKYEETRSKYSAEFDKLDKNLEDETVSIEVKLEYQKSLDAMEAAAQNTADKVAGSWTQKWNIGTGQGGDPTGMGSVAYASYWNAFNPSSRALSQEDQASLGNLGNLNLIDLRKAAEGTDPGALWTPKVDTGLFTNFEKFYANFQAAAPTLKKVSDSLLYYDAQQKSGDITGEQYKDKEASLMKELSPWYGRNNEAKRAAIELTRQEVRWQTAINKQKEVEAQYSKLWWQNVTTGMQMLFSLFGGGSRDMLDQLAGDNAKAQGSITDDTKGMKSAADLYKDSIKQIYMHIAWLRFEMDKFSLSIAKAQLWMEEFRRSIWWLTGGSDEDKAQLDTQIEKDRQTVATADERMQGATLQQYQDAAMKEMDSLEMMSGVDMGLGEGEGTDASGEGGTSTGTNGGKGKVRGSGYSIDFVICSQKQLPPLDPNLFKRKPVIDLTQKTFAIDKLNINTRDKPEVIEATMRKTIVDISESNRVNPTRVTTQEV